MTFYFVRTNNEAACRIMSDKSLERLLASCGITETEGSTVMHENGWVEYQVDDELSIFATEAERRSDKDLFRLEPDPGTIYTHNLAAEILDIFDDFLVDAGIKVPSVDDDDRDPDNEAALYGTEYSDLLDQVEEHIVELFKKKGILYRPYVFK